MIREDLFKEVASVIAERYKLKFASITRELSFKNDLSLNSLQMVEYVIMIEDKFNIEIPDNMLFRINTMGDLVDYLQKARG